MFNDDNGDDDNYSLFWPHKAKRFLAITKKKKNFKYFYDRKRVVFLILNTISCPQKGKW